MKEKDRRLAQASDGAESARPLRNDFNLEAATGKGNRKTSRNGVYLFNTALFSTVFAAVIVPFAVLRQSVDAAAIFVALLAALLALNVVHVAMDWERCVVMRFGRLVRVAGPGLFFTVPLVEFIAARVDQRTMATPFGAEETLTADLVPVDVDAVLFWMVWNPQKACTEVEDYPRAVSWIAQTTMRNAVGSLSIAEVATRRDQLDHELQETIAQKTEAWGITIISVEIRDILIPKELQDSMSREAQAERERNARVILAEIEQDISEMFSGAAKVYSRDELALQLRTMSLVYESVKAGNGGVVVLPSSFGDSFNLPGSGGGSAAGGAAGVVAGTAAAAGAITGAAEHNPIADLAKKLMS
ncbi:MAG: slipin family protein [Coriobacteriales bacterium]|jgi:regulator of protease activity HflC (stomatin/prohibitin superfamily)|nr:slipin family protein [Coriobacteriales bacterium]